MKALVDNHGQERGGTARLGADENRLIQARMVLAEKDQAARVKGIVALGGIKDPEALTTALHAFQAYVTGPENFAAQRSIVRLCEAFPERAAETVVSLVTLISARAEARSLTLVSEEFVKSCDTVESVLEKARLDDKCRSRIDETIGSWYERIKRDFQVAPTDMILVDPRDLVRFQNNSISDTDRKSMFAVLSMAMLAELMEGIKTPKATEIKKELLNEINADGFGDYVLQRLSSHNDPEVHDAVKDTLTRWGRSVTTPTNRFVMACAALTEMFRSDSAR